MVSLALEVERMDVVLCLVGLGGGRFKSWALSQRWIFDDH